MAPLIRQLWSEHPINELATFAQEQTQTLIDWQPAHPHMGLKGRYRGGGAGSRISGGSRSLSLLRHSAQLRW